MITTDLTTLKINKLTQYQYDTAKAAGNINENELYMTPEDTTSFTIPSGLIMMYYGSTIPDGWALCDGTNGTPDLRDRFVIGAGGTYNSGDTGGETSHTHKYKVGFRPYFGGLAGEDKDAIMAYDYTTNSYSDAVVVAQGEQSRVNNGLTNSYSTETPIFMGTEANTSTTDNMPPYYALYYIMKI